MNLIDALSELCHEVNRAYCEAHGDLTHKPWADTDTELRVSVAKGVTSLLTSDLTPEQLHSLWAEERTRQGWKYGAFKDVENKLHPNLVPYDQLPGEQKVKDYLFRAVVRTIQRQVG